MLPDAPSTRPRRLDAEGPAELLEGRFPGVRVWYGRHTGTWWAYIPVDGGRLVEADRPQRLADAIVRAAAGGRRGGRR
ncbi:hypothetical protein ACRYCC_23030 [Actinomadura scrupuli]|uniref:hypothetical protein n=1 Tax=Actinomadura scrupuli TaxID=559629 RepID=UPI003D99E024